MAQMPSWSHSLQFEPEPDSASRARDFVCLHLLGGGLPHLQEDVRLVVSELVTNAITHARTPFTVALERSGTSLLLTVRDLSTGVPVVSEADAMDGGGRGLGIVDLLSGAWGVTTDAVGSKSVWAEFDVEDALSAP